MDNEDLNKDENKESQIETGEAKEPTREELKSKIEEMISRVEKDHSNDGILSRLKDKLAHLSEKDLASHPNIIEEVNSLVDEAVRLVRKTVESIKEEEYEPSIDHLKNYNPDSVEGRMTKIRKASEKVQGRFEDIPEKMKEAMAVVAGEVFNNCEKPYALIGSNCYVPHTEYSAKIPDDLDVIFSITDYEKVISSLQNLRDKDGLVKDIIEEDVRNTDGTKGDKKIHCWVKSGDGWVEMEAFAQNMATEVYNGKEIKSYIPLGAEEKELEVIEIKNKEGKIVKVNIGSEKVAKELYIKNILKEFDLYNLNGWETRAMLNAKALQRIFNFTNLDSELLTDTESIDGLMDYIATIKPPTEKVEKVIALLGTYWKEFKGLKPKEGKEGLVDWLVLNADNGDGTKGLNIKDVSDSKDPEKAEKILRTEAAVDFITKETRKDMEKMSDKYNDLKLRFENIFKNENASVEEMNELIVSIEEEELSLVLTEEKYQFYMVQANGKNKNDFCVYAAMPQLRFQFIYPVSLNLMVKRQKLQVKIKEIENK